MIYQHDSIIIFDKTNNFTRFVDENFRNQESENYTVFKIGDTVQFDDFINISNKRLTGVIMKLGWSIGPAGPYITCGIKVKNAKYGKALLYNYIKAPISLTKIK